MKFQKMHGIGNDYIYIDCFQEDVTNPEEIAIKLSDRHFGIGGDGVVLILPSEVAACKMDMYNADGSQGKMCGNAIRCVAKYLFDQGLVEDVNISIETLSGIKKVKLNLKNGLLFDVTVNMGEPILEPEQIPVNISKADLQFLKEYSPMSFDKNTGTNNNNNASAIINTSASKSNASSENENIASNINVNTNKKTNANAIVSKPINVDGQIHLITCVSMGNPHAIIFVDDVNTAPVEKLGRVIENLPMFPDRINVEFVQIIDDANIKMRVWERGSGETLACGTGACASVVACVLNNRTKREVCVKLIGGELMINWDEKCNCLYMTGPAKKVFQGSVDMKDF